MEDAGTRNWLMKEEVEAFAGKNSDYYLEKWKSHSESTVKGWNFAAMFFSVEWMAYRKMYIEAMICFAILIIITMLLGLTFMVSGINISGTLGMLVGDAFRILAGLLGNMLYRKKALRTLHKTGDMDDVQRIEFLKRKGGTGIGAVILLILLELGFACFVLL